MKSVVLFLTSVFFFLNLYAQQALNHNLSLKEEKNKSSAEPGFNAATSAFSFSNLPTVGIYGIGNVNTESFNNINGSGKISGYVRPYKRDKKFVTVNFSFNKNASNSDSLLASTLIFPDIGNNSFLTTAEYSFCIGCGNNKLKKGSMPGKKGGQKIAQIDNATPKDEANVTNNDEGHHLLGIYYEFSTKSIRGRGDQDSLHFSTINHVLGLRYSFLKTISEDNITFSISPFMAIANIADQDNGDYRALFNKQSLPSHITSLGVKVSFQYNNLQAFADLRHVFGNENDFPRELRGFNANIGFVFNAELFER